MSKALMRTAARWRIPRDLALIVISRDSRCIYCNRLFETSPNSRAAWPSWEHIVNDGALVNASNIALCCASCNSSKGTKSLEKWLESKYCKEREITRHSMTPIAISGLLEPLGRSESPQERRLNEDL